MGLPAGADPRLRAAFRDEFGWDGGFESALAAGDVEEAFAAWLSRLNSILSRIGKHVGACVPEESTRGRVKRMDQKQTPRAIEASAATLAERRTWRA
eukprot:6001294-Alexandrium_andersonii.AAC.1